MTKTKPAKKHCGIVRYRHQLASYLILVGLFANPVFADEDGDEGNSGGTKILDALFEQEQGGPGCAVGYAVEGEIKYLKGFGMANLEHNVPITPKTRFHIASVSKEFTGAAIGLLILEGKLSLEDDVRTYLPEIPEFGQTITVRHLLQHTSGLANHTKLMPNHGMDYGNAFSQQEMLDLVFAEGLNFEPGSRYEYGASYLVLGLLVEKLSGMPLRQFLKQRIFEPLGMHNSGLHDDFSLIPNRAEGYLKDGDQWANDRVRYALIGSGGVHMTIGDLLIWNHALRNDGLVEGLAELVYESPSVKVMENLDYHFGFFRTEFRNARATAHSGSYQGAKTLLYDFEPGYATAIACNHRVDVREMTWALIAEIAPEGELD